MAQHSLYYDMISDYHLTIAQEIDIDRMVHNFPHKYALDFGEFTDWYLGANELGRSEFFIKHILDRRRINEMETFFNMVTEEDSLQYLKAVLDTRKKTRMKSRQESEKGFTDNSLEGSHSHQRKRVTFQDEQEVSDDHRTALGVIKEESYISEEEDSSREELDTGRSTFREKAEAFDKDVADLKVELESARSLIRQKTEEINNLSVKQRGLASELQAADKKVVILNNKVESLDKDLSLLKKENEEFKEENEALNNKVDSLSQEVESVRTELDVLKKSNDELVRKNNEKKESKSCVIL